MIVELGVVLILFLILILLLSFVFISTAISFKSAPFVPTSNQDLEEIFTGWIKKGQTLMDLGSGDGRVVRYVSDKFQVKGLGIELNPILVWYSRIIDRLQGTGVSFQIRNIYDVDLKGFDVIFLFLLPQIVEKLGPKLIKKLKKEF